MKSPLREITIEQLYKQAAKYAGDYTEDQQELAKKAFVEAVLWCISVDEGRVDLTDN